MSEIISEAETREQEETAFYHEAALNANWTGSRLAIGALSFLFGAFAFAYFYLFSSDGHGMWLPSSTRIPSNHYGETITGLIVVSAIIQTVGLQLIKRGSKSAWTITAAVALVFGTAAVAIQVNELLNLPFQPGASGFASVFVGFYPVALVSWLAAMVWLEIMLARSRRIPAISFIEQPPTFVETREVQRFQSSLSGFTVVWNYLAVVTFIFWLLFYVR
jgi:heme/copper-type cytochrome/quinol oxidase subunit 3